MSTVLRGDCLRGYSPSNKKERSIELKKGAITVFTILITTSILTIGGVMIDLGRIILAEYAVASMSETATRSMMANYDADLVGDYGLFAIEDSKDNKEAFTKYLKRNLNADDNNNATGKSFSLLKLKNASLVEDDISVSFSKPISDQEVFKEQVKDYHTPRTIVIGVDRIISQVSGLLKNKAVSSLTKGAEEVSNIQEKVVSQEGSAKTKLEMFKRVTSNPEKLVEVKWKNAYNSLEKSIENSIGKKGISAVFNVSNREIFKKREFTDIMGLDNAADEAIQELDLMLETINQAESELSSIKADSSVEEYNEYEYYGDDCQDYVETGTSNDEIAERVIQIKQNIENAKETINTKKKNFEKYADDEVVMQVILSAYEYYSNENMSYEEFLSIVSSNKSSINNQEILSSVTEMESFLQNSVENKPTDEAKKALENGRTKCYTGMNKQVDDISNIDVGSIMEIKKTEPKPTNPETDKQEENAGNIYDDVVKLKNTLVKDNSKYQIYKEGTGNSVVDNIITWIANQLGIGLFNEIVNTVESFNEDSLGEQIVYASYVMDKTNSITSSTKRQHYFNFAETEYVLHNYSLEGLNALQSVCDVIKWRFVIDTAYYLVFRSPHAVEGITFLVKLGYSATRGAIQAVEDVFKMVIMGEKIPIVPITNATTKFLGGQAISVSYRDHLMIAMIFEGKKVPRMINTINATVASKAELEGKTKSMTNMYTEAKTKVVVDCDLVFLNIFGFRDILGNVYDGKYRIIKENTFSY